MKKTLTKQPDHYTYRELKMRFQDGAPLSCDQLNFLARHEKTLSSQGLDSLMKYYLKPYKNKAETHHSQQKHPAFILHKDRLAPKDVEHFLEQLQLQVKSPTSSVIFSMTPEQFTALRLYSVPDLVLYHGNEFLAGTPYFIDGIPYTLYFRCGNLFGVAKYVFLAEERALRSNLLIYVETMQNRHIHQCIQDYNKHRYLEQELKKHEFRAHEEAHLYTNEYTKTAHHIPKLTLSISTKRDDDKDR